MKPTLRRLVAAAVVAIVAMGSSAVPAHADHPMVGAYWGTFKWHGVQQSPLRAFFVLDRSGDPIVGAALREFTQTFNEDAYRRGLFGIVPIPVYLDQSYTYTGHCGGYTNFPGYSFSTVCSGNGGAYGSSITWFGSPGTQAEMGYHAWSRIQRDYPDYNTTYSTVAHEFIHQLGIGHSSDCRNLMGGGEFGCRLTVGVKRYLTEHDWAALADAYRRIPMSR